MDQDIKDVHETVIFNVKAERPPVATRASPDPHFDRSYPRPQTCRGPFEHPQFGLIRPDAGCPGTLKRLPVSTTSVPFTSRIEKSWSI